MIDTKVPKRILPIIMVTQFLCTSLWFAGNAVLTDIIKNFPSSANLLANLTSMVQFGFIAGTFVFALLSIADRFSPSKVFLICALFAGLLNLGVCLPLANVNWILLFRFLTGFMLAGIYPVGMKIAADYFKDDLGKSLGFLVGALVMGTAFPYLLKSVGLSFPWQYVIYITSLLSALGGLVLCIFVPNGPYRNAGQKIVLAGFLGGLKSKKFSTIAIGYFGHMWELYAFWAFLPVMLAFYKQTHQIADLNIVFTTFFIIATGGLGCMVGGYLSQRYGAKKIATLALVCSGCCCLISPILFSTNLPWLLICFLLVWGLVITADSPLFSALIARNAADKFKGTALTIVNCVGFFITIISIQLLNSLAKSINMQNLYLILAVGPIVGAWVVIRNA